MGFFALWGLSHYGICRVMEFVAYWVYRIIVFVALGSLLQFGVCHLLVLLHYGVYRIVGFFAFWINCITRFVANYGVGQS